MNDLRFDITCPDPEAEVKVSPVSSEDGIALYRVSVRLPEKRVPSPVRIEWEDEMRDILSAWFPSCGVYQAAASRVARYPGRACGTQ